MARRPTVLIILSLTVLVASAALLFAPLMRLPCGHRGSMASRLWPVGPFGHSCDQQELIKALRYLHQQGEKYWDQIVIYYAMDKDRRPPQAPYDFVALLENDWMAFSGAGKDWQCHVAREPDFPGYYLMTSDGTIYFSEDHPATTHDEVLPQ
jgi:hypothetical protein